MKGVLIAAQSSGCGKTMTAIGLAAHLRLQGLKVAAAKCGPDFLDGRWLAAATGRPCFNLDTWMGQGEDITKLPGLFANADFAVVEGVMGFYDGAAAGYGSTASVALAFNLPVLLILTARHMGQSIAAVAEGFLSYKAPDLEKTPDFCGILIAGAYTDKHIAIVRKAIEPVCEKYNVPLLGFLKHCEDLRMDSCEQGLRRPEGADFSQARAAEWFISSVDAGKLLQLPDLPFTPAMPAPPACQADDMPVIAIARDKAFCFCYADLPARLQAEGARVAYFSPLADKSPPDGCHAIYIPGGYMRDYEDELAANTEMTNSIVEKAISGMPIYGENYGYVYMLGSMANHGRCRRFTGILPGVARMAPAKKLGYRKLRAHDGDAIELRGHEHHNVSTQYALAQPLWEMRDAQGSSLGNAGQRLRNVFGSMVQLYPAGSMPFWRKFVAEARKYKQKNGGIQRN